MEALATTDDHGVEMRKISKRFGGIRALEEVSFTVRRGEVHALLGENGAGKSTLMKILSGAYQKDAGEIRLGGRPVEITNPHVSRALGIGIIYQELALAPDLTVAENIFLGDLPGLIRRGQLRTRAAALLRELGFDLDPAATVRDLPLAYQQVVEIAKAISRDVRVLILDEPTAVLAPQEARRLLKVVRDLSRRGVSVIYISHRLEEIFEVADAITVLKDGRTVGTVSPRETDVDGLINMMVGRRVTTLFPPARRTPGEVVLRVENLQRGEKVQGISFQVRAGEVLGVAGLVGSGRTETARAIFGADPRQGGTVSVAGRARTIRSPRDGVRAGIGLVPEDRKGQGVITSLSVRQNATMPVLGRFTNFCNVINRKREEAAVGDLIRRLVIKTRHMDAPVDTLSGGNQQKVALSKWFEADCRVILLDEPTRGVDVGAKAEIYRLVDELASRGLGVVLISSDLLEVIGMSDRILVMGRGRVAGELARPDFSETNIMRLALREIERDHQLVA